MPRLALALALLAVLPGPAAAGEEEAAWDEVEAPPRLDLAVWGGQAWSEGGGGPRSDALAGEATWRFDAVDLGLLGGRYVLRLADAAGAVTRTPASVWLLRVGQRFEARSGLLTTFTFGAGALKSATWRSWFQVALGGRVTFGPAFVAGELSFESEQLLRLSLGLGVSLF